MYSGLLGKISKRYNILQGEAEEISDWKVRLIYSVCGLMGYASLWDTEEDQSIVHFKRRICKILASYREMYPEISDKLPSSDKLAEEFSGMFKDTGVIYHRSNCVRLAIRKDAIVGETCLQRGITPDDIKYVSGVGFYSDRHEPDKADGVRLMFGLEEQNLLSVWETTLKQASWSEHQFPYGTTYMRMLPPFNRGYWVNEPDRTNTVSLMRAGNKGAKSYYLYKCDGRHIDASSLKPCMVENGNYLLLANACLSVQGSLPPIEYCFDKNLVHIHLQYLLPPRELAFLKLYSWPKNCTDLPCNFERKCSLDVFNVIKAVFEEEGYLFTERKK